jgi:hypothetical protein
MRVYIILVDDEYYIIARVYLRVLYTCTLYRALVHTNHTTYMMIIIIIIMKIDIKPWLESGSVKDRIQVGNCFIFIKFWPFLIVYIFDVLFIYK